MRLAEGQIWHLVANRSRRLVRNDVRLGQGKIRPSHASDAADEEVGFAGAAPGLRGELLMVDELTFYTHPMSRGRIVRWMLEELGQPYLDQPDGESAGDPARRHRGDRSGRHLRLSRRCVSGGPPCAAAGRSAARSLLSLAI